jgi:hypothetical protein
MPEPQVYFTTFGQNDLHVANALTTFFQRQGWTKLAGCVDVVERLLIFVWTAIVIMISAIRVCGGKSIDETFGQNDLHVANALTTFFQRQGWTKLAGSYKENLRAYFGSSGRSV